MDIVEKFSDEFMRHAEGKRGVEDLKAVCDILGYGEGWLRGRALEEFLADNPGAVEGLFEFIKDWADRNQDWKDKMREVLEHDGLLDDEE